MSVKDLTYISRNYHSQELPIATMIFDRSRQIDKMMLRTLQTSFLLCLVPIGPSVLGDDENVTCSQRC